MISKFKYKNIYKYNNDEMMMLYCNTDTEMRKNIIY
jgi:hypothetical protein